MNIFENVWEGLKGGVKSLTGNYTPGEKKAIQDNFKRIQGQQTSLGDSVRITGNVIRNGGQYNPNDQKDYMAYVVVALGAILVFKILD